MKANHKITGAEREVMEVLWERTEPMQTRELLDVMTERGKKWKRQKTLPKRRMWQSSFAD